MISTCFLCGEDLSPEQGFQVHPERDDCLVRFTDSYGIAIDPPLAAIEPDGDKVDPEKSDFFAELDIRLFPSIDECLVECFAEVGLQRLGGVSTGRGWSVFSTYQKCRYLYYRKYVEPLPAISIIPGLEPEARAIGSIAHALLAVYYSRMIVPDYPLTPESLRDRLLQRGNPELIHEGWRLFFAYSLFYQGEDIRPLAVEFDLRDPRTNESCRFDLIAFFPDPHDNRPAGTYNVEHKTSQRFDNVTLNGWANEGEVLGQMLLWKRMKLQLRFGELQGTIINLLGRQKDPKFHRTFVAPETWQIDQHASDLKQFEAEMHMTRTLGVYPRSRTSCINRYGMCDLYDYCATSKE